MLKCIIRPLTWQWSVNDWGWRDECCDGFFILFYLFCLYCRGGYRNSVITPHWVKVSGSKWSRNKKHLCWAFFADRKNVYFFLIRNSWKLLPFWWLMSFHTAAQTTENYKSSAEILHSSAKIKSSLAYGRQKYEPFGKLLLILCLWLFPLMIPGTSGRINTCRKLWNLWFYRRHDICKKLIQVQKHR